MTNSYHRLVELLGKNELVTTGLNGTVALAYPFNIETDTEQAAGFAKLWDSTAEVFLPLATSSSGDNVAANYQVSVDADSEADGDALYLGGAAKFGSIVIDMSATVAVYGADSVTWEYFSANTSDWATLSIVWDGTDADDGDGDRPFQQDGSILFSAPDDWASTTIDSQAAFWIRARYNATVNITTAGLTNSVEHKITTAAGATEAPFNGSIGRGRFSWGTVSAANNATEVILVNLSNGKCSAIKTLATALVEHEVADFSVECNEGDAIALFVLVVDGSTEYANGTLELTFSRGN